MTISLKHSFTSPKADGIDSTMVQPSNWNAEHVITLAAGKVLGRDSSGAGAAQELPLSFDPSGQSMVPPVGTTAQRPATPVTGMLRFNTSFSKFEQYNGTSWGSIGGGATISDTAPASPQPGDLWWDSDEGQLYVYYFDGTDSFWVVANAFSGGNAYLPLTGGSVSGPLGDAIGNVRSIPVNNQTSAYVLAASDNGKMVSITTGGVTVPANILTPGQNVVIVNNSSSNQTITQGAGVTMTFSGVGTTGNRTLALYGVATVLCIASNTFIISGSGLS